MPSPVGALDSPGRTSRGSSPVPRTAMSLTTGEIATDAAPPSAVVQVHGTKGHRMADDQADEYRRRGGTSWDATQVAAGSSSSAWLVGE